MKYKKVLILKHFTSYTDYYYTNIYEFRQNDFHFAPKYKHKPKQFKNDCAEINIKYTPIVCIKL